MSNSPALIEMCFAHAEHAIQRVNVLQHEKAGPFHAGVNAAKSLLDDARVEELQPNTLAKRLWALRVLAALNTPWSLWSEGLTEASSAALHAVQRLLPDEMKWTPPADAEEHPTAVVAEVAAALGYRIQLVPDLSLSAGSGWRWFHQHTRPVVRTTQSAAKFGSATRAYTNACKHAVEQLMHPSWQWPQSARVPTQVAEQAALHA